MFFFYQLLTLQTSCPHTLYHTTSPIGMQPHSSAHTYSPTYMTSLHRWYNSNLHSHKGMHYHSLTYYTHTWPTTTTIPLPPSRINHHITLHAQCQCQRWQMHDNNDNDNDKCCDHSTPPSHDEHHSPPPPLMLTTHLHSHIDHHNSTHSTHTCARQQQWPLLCLHPLGSTTTTKTTTMVANATVTLPPPSGINHHNMMMMCITSASIIDCQYDDDGNHITWQQCSMASPPAWQRRRQWGHCVHASMTQTMMMTPHAPSASTLSHWPSWWRWHQDVSTPAWWRQRWWRLHPSTGQHLLPAWRRRQWWCNTHG